MIKAKACLTKGCHVAGATLCPSLCRPPLVSVHWLHSSLSSAICMGNCVSVVVPACGRSACTQGNSSAEGRMPRGIRTDGQARDNKLLNSLSLGMLEELILMLSETKLLQTGSHVCVSQPCCPRGWSGSPRRRCTLP